MVEALKLDPIEQIIADALDNAGIAYVTDHGGGNPSGLDFRIANGIEIEVKRFHSDRIAEQMSRAENVIAVQGIEAARWLAGIIGGGDCRKSSDKALPLLTIA